MSDDSAKSWVQAEWEDSLDEELEMEIDDLLIAKDLAFISELKHKSSIERNTYFHELLRLQAELVKMQDWVQHSGEKLVVIFEGRDAAGKGGVIKRISQRLNPRVCRVVALPAPTEREKTQWYFQRYVPHLPAAGEMVLFDRSWYNRSGVERVMGFASEAQVEEFFNDVSEFERMLVRSGIRLVKYWFSITDQEQQLRFLMRIHDPLKQWKLSPMGPGIPRALGGLHQGEGRNLRADQHSRSALVHRGRQRQEAGPAELHQPSPVHGALRRRSPRSDQASRPGGPNPDYERKVHARAPLRAQEILIFRLCPCHSGRGLP